jgi:XisI protein
MDKIAKYETAILGILNEYAKVKYANIKGENHLVMDKDAHHYLVLTIGWDGKQYIHDCPMHMDIVNGKIWIQKNMTEWEIGEMLEAKGVPKKDIVIGFLSPKMREYSDYAVA